MPELMETSDFLQFRFITLNGPAAQNKGMALFPRKINGLYAMLSRQDNENLYLVFSDNVHFWYEPKLILAPDFPGKWCRSATADRRSRPMPAGWSSATAWARCGSTAIGAFLLDQDDPSKVIGRLREPLLEPTEDERAAMCPTSCTPAARWCMAADSSFRTPMRTTPPVSRLCHWTRCWARWSRAS